jgi:hypothetical protein
MRSFIFYTLPQILLGKSHQGERLVGHVACMGEERNVCKVLMGKPEGKRPLVRPRRRWRDGIRMHLRERSWGV